MKKLLNNLLREEKGQSLILVTFALVFLLGFAAIVIDLASVNVTKTKLQTAADAAALAGAAELPNMANAKTKAEDYAQSNGVSKSDVTVTTPYGGNADKIEVVIAEKVEYTFAKVLGFTSGDVVARAVAEKSGFGGGPFGYAVFSGDPNHELVLGQGFESDGSVHSNGSLTLNNKTEIQGAIEYVKNIKIAGYKGKAPTKVDIIDMPDFSAEIKEQASLVGTYIDGNWTVAAGADQSTWKYPIYVNGSMTVNGSGFTGQGVILVKNNVEFNGSGATLSSPNVAIYSELGNITFNGAINKIIGLVYAPKGTITFNGANVNITGRVIGYRVTFNGSGNVVIVPTGGEELFESMKLRLVE